MMKIEKDHSLPSIACTTDEFQQETSENFFPPKLENLTSMTSVQAPTLPPGTCFQSYQQMVNHSGSYFMPGVPTQFSHDRTQSWTSMAMTDTQTMQLPSVTLQHSSLNWQLLHNPQAATMVLSAGGSGEMPCCHIPETTASYCQRETTSPKTRSTKAPSDLELQKRELRLMKNREAARECRRKRKEYVRCLENRVTLLESQNQALINELKALYHMCPRKAE